MLATLAEAAAATGRDGLADGRRGQRRVPARQPAAAPTAAGCARGRPTGGPATWPTPPTTPPLVDAFTRLAEATGEARWIDEARGRPPTPCSTCSGTTSAAGCSPPAPTPRRWSPDPRTSWTTPRRRPTASPRWPAPPRRPHRRRRATRSGPRTSSRLLGGPAGRAPDGVRPPARRRRAPACAAPPRSPWSATAPTWCDEVQRRYLPNAVLAWGEPYESPLWEGRRADGRAYVCRNYACQPPAPTRDALAAQLAAELAAGGYQPPRWTTSPSGRRGRVRGRTGSGGRPGAGGRGRSAPTARVRRARRGPPAPRRCRGRTDRRRARRGPRRPRPAASPSPQRRVDVPVRDRPAVGRLAQPGRGPCRARRSARRRPADGRHGQDEHRRAEQPGPAEARPGARRAA